MKKIGRNDPCHCGSGKKFKKCCESKMIRGRFMATRLNDAPTLQTRAMNLSSLFQAHAIQPKISVPEPLKEEITAQTLEGKGDILVSS